MYNSFDLDETIVAIATPAGSGAIAVIRLSGKNAITIVDNLFKSKKLIEQATHTIHLGYIRDEKNVIVDQVLVSLFKEPNSYTKENVVEVSCHGSRFIQQRLIELFLRQGARMAREGEFTLRAFLNGQMDLSQAEAVADLISADSESAHQLALQQMRGGFSDEIQKLREDLIHFASLIELELDFGEEDVEFADRDDLKELVNKIQTLLKRLLDSFQLGNAIKNGINTVIAGRPNAGKSTLLNALLNEDRAIVSAIAGTTRDTIEEVLNIKGVEFRLIDTAGIREAGDQIEAIGVEKTLEKVAQSSILVYVYDMTTLKAPDVKADLDKLYKEGMKVLMIANKCDEYYSIHDNVRYHMEKEASEKGWDQIFEDLGTKGFYYREITAKEKRGLDGLKEDLYNAVLDGELMQGDVVVSNLRHYEALQKSNESLDKVLEGLQMGITGDFLAMDIRHALHHLGEITGEISTDDLLGNIFSNFCIGK
ncbi:MAG: tRNA uridine-5-carboxymethylaminomethyl(34) synthesis GTPase MnmE [Aureispira sp.]|nr:tRNA uridine-5-carboxymethylaminomethyl(34) synthesis GTPase MnmE [Aureispira sp.]